MNDLSKMHRLVLALAVTACAGSATELPALPAVADYKPPAGRSIDMQMFDKAALYLAHTQEPDGHWDSAKLGAAPEFRNYNGDLATTSIATYVLMCTSSGINQNPAAVAHARAAIRWMEPRIKDDGALADPAGPGEPVVAQLLAGSAFMQAASMSTRDTLRQHAVKVMTYALLKMKAKSGGYGPAPDSPEPRSDTLGLSAFVFKSAALDGYKFESAGKPADDDILATLRAGFKRLDTGGEKLTGTYAAQPGGPPEWRATVGCMLANFLINPQRSAVAPALDFVFGELDKQKELYRRIPQHIAWGQSGEGYDAMIAWQGTMAVVYLFTDDKYQYKSWINNYRALLKDHQRPDGAWDVAGEDAKRGLGWRTAIQAMTLILTAPPPPPPVPQN